MQNLLYVPNSRYIDKNIWITMGVYRPQATIYVFKNVFFDTAY